MAEAVKLVAKHARSGVVGWRRFEAHVDELVGPEAVEDVLGAARAEPSDDVPFCMATVLRCLARRGDASPQQREAVAQACLDAGCLDALAMCLIQWDGCEAGRSEALVRMLRRARAAAAGALPAATPQSPSDGDAVAAIALLTAVAALSPPLVSAQFGQLLDRVFPLLDRDDADVRHAAERCLAVLPTRADEWGDLLAQVTREMKLSMDTVRLGAAGVSTRRREDAGKRAVRRFESLVLVCRTMLSTRYPFPCTVPVSMLIDVIDGAVKNPDLRRPGLDLLLNLLQCLTPAACLPIGTWAVQLVNSLLKSRQVPAGGPLSAVILDVCRAAVAALGFPAVRSLIQSSSDLGTRVLLDAVAALAHRAAGPGDAAGETKRRKRRRDADHTRETSEAAAPSVELAHSFDGSEPKIRTASVRAASRLLIACVAGGSFSGIDRAVDAVLDSITELLCRAFLEVVQLAPVGPESEIVHQLGQAAITAAVVPNRTLRLPPQFPAVVDAWKRETWFGRVDDPGLMMTLHAVFHPRGAPLLSSAKTTALTAAPPKPPAAPIAADAAGAPPVSARSSTAEHLPTPFHSAVDHTAKDTAEAASDKRDSDGDDENAHDQAAKTDERSAVERVESQREDEPQSRGDYRKTGLEADTVANDPVEPVLTATTAEEAAPNPTLTVVPAAAAGIGGNPKAVPVRVAADGRADRSTEDKQAREVRPRRPPASEEAMDSGVEPSVEDIVAGVNFEDGPDEDDDDDDDDDEDPERIEP